MLVAPLTPGSLDEDLRDKAASPLSQLPIRLSAGPTAQPPEIDARATDHIVYDSVWPMIPGDMKTELLDLLQSKALDLVIISTPTTGQARLDTLLQEAAASSTVTATKSPALPSGTTSSVDSDAFHGL